jgi:hypothetical protein
MPVGALGDGLPDALRPKASDGNGGLSSPQLGPFSLLAESRRWWRITATSCDTPEPDAKTTGEMKVDSKSKASDSTTPTTTSKDVKNPTAETKPTSDSKTAGEMKPDGKTKASEPTTTSKDLKTPTAETKPSSDSKTTGNAATSATAAPPAEKRTQITSAIKQEKVEEVTNVNFNVSVGTVVPAGVRYHPLPSHVVEIYPEWRGYDFILVRGRYIILRPHTHEIGYIIEG